MPFCLSGAEWPEDPWGSGDCPEDPADDEYPRFSRDQLRESLASLQNNSTVPVHPKASLEQWPGSEFRLIVYRSGRVEWCPESDWSPGYNPGAAYLWATEEKAQELWLRLLRGDLAAIATEPGCE